MCLREMVGVTVRREKALDFSGCNSRSGLAEQRTFSIGGSVWSILASCRDCSITRAKARIFRRARNEEQKYVPSAL